MISKRLRPSYRRTSKSLTGAPLEQQYWVRHSILKMRLGALPEIEVNIPCPAAWSMVYRSSQNGKIVLLNVASGKHALEYAPLVEVNCRVPLELAFTEVNG